MLTRSRISNTRRTTFKPSNATKCSSCEAHLPGFNNGQDGTQNLQAATVATRPSIGATTANSCLGGNDIVVDGQPPGASSEANQARSSTKSTTGRAVVLRRSNRLRKQRTQDLVVAYDFDNDENDNNENNRSYPPIPKRMKDVQNVLPLFKPTPKAYHDKTQQQDATSSTANNSTNANTSANNPTVVMDGRKLDDLQKLESLEKAREKANQLLGIIPTRESCQPCTMEEQDNHFEMQKLALLLVTEVYDRFKIERGQKIKSKYKKGVYCVSSTLVKNHLKIGCSCVNLSKRVKDQGVNPYDESQAFCLMTPGQIQSYIPDRFVEEFKKLYPHGLQFHDSHEGNKLELDIKTYLTEFVCVACTNCPNELVLERLFELPSTRVREMSAPLTNDEVRQDDLDWLRPMEGVHLVLTWKTMNSKLHIEANKAGDKALQQRLATREGFATLHFFERTFSENMIKTVVDAIEDNPTFDFCHDKAREIQDIVGKKSVQDLSPKEEDKIRAVFKLFEHDKDWYWNPYIGPVLEVLGEAAIPVIESVCKEIEEQIENPQGHFIIVEHALIKAMEEFKKGWTKRNIRSQADLGKKIYFWTHKNGRKIIVVPSFFRTVAPNTKMEIKMNNLESLAHFFKILHKAGIISDDHFNREMRLIVSFAMRMEDGSFLDGRNTFLPEGFCQGPPKNNLNVFGNIGDFGIPTAVGQALAFFLGLTLFQQLLNRLYGMPVNTPYDPDSPGCLGFDGEGCRAESESDERLIFCVAAKEPHNPAHMMWLCENCRRSKAYNTFLIKALEERKKERPLTEAEQDLLNTCSERRDRGRNHSRKHHEEKVRGTALEKNRRCLQQDIVNNDPERREAAKARAKQRDQKQKENGVQKQSSTPKYSKNEDVRYPPRLRDHYMCKGLLLFLLKFGRSSMGSEIINQVLKAILIGYQDRFPDEQIVEDYVEEPGKNGEVLNKVVFFQKEFQKVTKKYMTHEKGKLWKVKEEIISKGEIEEAKTARLLDGREKKGLIDSTVIQTFDESFAFPEEKTRHLPKKVDRSAPGVKLCEVRSTRRNPRWKAYTGGINLSYL